MLTIFGHPVTRTAVAMVSRMKDLIAPGLFLVLLVYSLYDRLYLPGSCQLNATVKNTNWELSSLNFGAFRLDNVSQGHNYRSVDCSAFQRGFLNFTANRVWRAGPCSVVHIVLLMYPSSWMGRVFGDFVTWLRDFSRNPCDSACRSVFLVLTSENVSKWIARDPCFAPETVDWSHLDYGYELFWYRARSRLPFVFSAVPLTQFFSRDFLEGNYVTPDGLLKFRGYYAACFGLFTVLPGMLRFLDFFDFWSRMDIDFRPRGIPGFERETLWPMGQMVEKRAYLFGCRQDLDHPTVAHNVFRFVGYWASRQSKACKVMGPFRIASVENSFLVSEQQKVPGALHISWLGLFSSPEVISFARSYFEFEDGFRRWRWGDQQFMFLVNALFAENAPNRTIFDSRVPQCRHHQLSVKPYWKSNVEEVRATKSPSVVYKEIFGDIPKRTGPKHLSRYISNTM